MICEMPTRPDSLLTDPMRCLACGYILEHLTEPRCPECGRPFDPHDSTTYRCLRDPSAEVWLAALALAITASMLAIAVDSRFDSPGVGFALVVAGIAANIVVLVRSLIALLKSPLKTRFRGGWIAALTISLLYLISCLGIWSVLRIVDHIRDC